MQRIKVRDIEIDVDEGRTSRLYERRLDGCLCDFCMNARIASRRHTPSEQVEALLALGVDPWRPCLSAFPGRRPYDPKRHTRRLACWFLYGKIVGNAPTSRVNFGGDSWIGADTSRTAIHAWDDALEDLDGDPDLVYVFTSNALPWLLGEVCEFRRERGAKCEVCGDRYRQTGYLKRRSLIPEWEGLPHLREVLLARKERVYVEFCSTCGHLEYKIVSRTPPFRQKSEVDRRIEKAARTQARGTGPAVTDIT
jgi:hypothetical protein